METTREEIRKIAEETIKKNLDDVTALCNSLNVSIEELIEAWVVWDTGINEYDNSVYSSNAMRIAMHLHNYINGNWHDKRQEKVMELIEKIRPKKIIDVGFGTPQRYVGEYVLKNKTQLSLLDFDEESLIFARAFLDTKSQNWKEHVHLKKYDMNSGEPLETAELYLFQDSIEHTDNPPEYFKTVVAGSDTGSHFILSIPIEVDKAVPEHNIFWRSMEHALGWVGECGLKIVEYVEIEMNPKLDLFAKHLHPAFKEIVVHAVKP